MRLHMKQKKRLKLFWGDVQGFRPGSGPVSNSVQGANWDSLIKGGPAEKNLLRSLDRSIGPAAPTLDAEALTPLDPLDAQTTVV